MMLRPTSTVSSAMNSEKCAKNCTGAWVPARLNSRRRRWDLHGRLRVYFGTAGRVLTRAPLSLGLLRDDARWE